MKQIHALSVAVAIAGMVSGCSSDSGANGGVVPVTGAPNGGTSTSSAGTSAGGGSAGTNASAGSTAIAGTGGTSSAGASNGGSGGSGPPMCMPACTTDQACVEGKCMPKPTQLTQVAGCGTMYLALNKDTLYFTDSMHGKVSSIPVAGGTATDVATGQKAPIAIAVDDNAVYFSTSGANAGDNTLMMKATAGTAQKISASTKTTNAITLDGKGAIYYGDGDDLMKVNAMPASTPAKIGTLEGVPTAIVITPTRLFMTLGLDNAVQWRNPDPAASGCTDPVARPVGSTTGGCSFEESQGNLLLDSLGLEGNKVIWANGPLMQSADTTVDATMMGSGHSIASTDSFDNISGFAANASTVYFGEATTGIIEMAPLPDGDPVILVEDQTSELQPSSFVMDDSNVYWRTKDCSIMKLAIGGVAAL